MAYSGTEKNIWALNDATQRPLLATHYTFDEAHMSTTTGDIPPYALALQRTGYRNTLDLPETAEPQSFDELPIKIINKDASLPTRSTSESAGLDIRSIETATLHPHTITAVPTGLMMELKKKTYGQVQSRSGLAAKQGIFAIPGVIDSDYRGEVKILLMNTTDAPVIIPKNQRIAQMIIHSIHLPQATEKDIQTQTERGEQGFGSTEVREQEEAETGAPVKSPEPAQPTQTTNPTPPNASNRPDIIPAEPKEIIDQRYGQGQRQGTGGIDSPAVIENDDTTPVVHATISEMLQPYSIHVSSDIYDNILVRHLQCKGSHPTRGLIIKQCPHRNLPTILECKAGTDAGRMKKWRSTIRGAYILAINDEPMESEEYIQAYFEKHTEKDHIATLKLGTIEKQAMHPDDGIPVMYFDQLNIIAQHLREMKYGANIEENPAIDQPTVPSQDTRLAATTRMLKAIFMDGIIPHTAAIRAAQELKPKNKQKGKKLTR